MVRVPACEGLFKSNFQITVLFGQLYASRYATAYQTRLTFPRRPIFPRKGSQMPKRGTSSDHREERIAPRDMDWDAMEQAETVLDRMPSVLPTGSVALLAREVIARLAERPVAAQMSNEMTPLAASLIGADDGAPLRLVMRLLAGGVAVETVYLTHLAGAARELGHLWEQDLVPSAQVTIAAGRIYMIMRGLGAHLAPVELPRGRHAIFAAVPGEKHTLGISMAADLFRKEGWLIDLKIGMSHDELIEEVLRTEASLMGLSASSKTVLPELIRLIASVRMSLPHIRILVSGSIVSQEPDLKRICDADAVASDFETARTALQDMWDALGGPTRRILQ